MYRLVILLFLCTASAQRLFEGACNFTGVATNFNASYITGKWHQLERIPNIFEAGDCSTITFTSIIENGQFKGHEFTNIEVANRTLVLRNGTISQNSSYPANVLNFTFSDGTSYDYVIIQSTPYQHESMVLYSCQSIDDFRLVWAWKLARNQRLSPEATNVTEQNIANIEDLFNATWRVTSFTEESCKSSSEMHLSLHPLFVFVTASFIFHSFI